LARWWFHVPLHDVHCGLRGFKKDFYRSLQLRCTGMEFATEMVIKAALYRGNIAEIPITLYPDGRKAHAPHLRTFRDGWRHLRFYLMCSPRWLFLIPGTTLILLGFAGYGIAMPRTVIHGITFDVHTLLFASLAILCGYQLIIFAISAKTFAIGAGLLPDDPRVNRFFKYVYLEHGLIVSLLALLLGGWLLLAAVIKWQATGFGNLDYVQIMRLVIPGATLTALAIQTVFSSFFLSMLALARR
jgi:hypothetical protein